MNAYEAQLRDEYEAGRLETIAEEAAWASQRDEDLGIERHWVAPGVMEYRWAKDRAEVEAESPTGEEWRREAMLASKAVEWAEGDE